MKKKHGATYIALLAMMIVLCLTPAMAGALDPATQIVGAADAYTWDADQKLLTVTGKVTVSAWPNEYDSSTWFDVLIKDGGDCTMERDVAGNVTVEGGVLNIQCGMVGDLRVSDGEVNISSGTPGVKGSLNISGGKVLIKGQRDTGGSAGVYLTKNSEISGGEVTIIGGNGGYDPASALDREPNAVLNVTGGSLLLKGGVHDPNMNSASTDPLPPAPAISEGNENMLKWNLPVQMKAGNYNPDLSYEKNLVHADSSDSLAGKHVVQSYRACAITFDAGIGKLSEGTEEVIIVPEGDIFTIDAPGIFVAPEGYLLSNWKIITNDGEQLGLKTVKVTQNMRIEPVWQVDPAAEKNLPADGQGDGLPETGDPSSLLGWAALLGASGFGAKMLKRRKK